MDPSIKIGNKIELDTKYKSFQFQWRVLNNELQDGVQVVVLYTVMKITYSGDNYGQVHGLLSAVWLSRWFCGGLLMNAGQLQEIF